MHVSFEESMNVQASNIMVTSSEESPNTDGIHVTRSENVQIIKTVIKTGKPREKIIKFRGVLILHETQMLLFYCLKVMTAFPL